MHRSSRNLRSRALPLALLGLLLALVGTDGSAAGAALSRPASATAARTGAAVAAWPGDVAGTGYIGLHLANTPDGRIRATWSPGAATRVVRRWRVSTSTTQKMNRHVRSVLVAGGQRSVIV